MNRIIFWLFLLTPVPGMCQNKVTVSDTLIAIDDVIVFNNFNFSILTQEDINTKFPNHKRVRYKSGFKRNYGRKFTWYFLAEYGIAFEIDKRDKYLTRIQLFFDDHELNSNEIENVSKFTGNVLFHDSIIRPGAAFENLKKWPKLSSTKDESILYLFSKTGSINTELYFYDSEKKISKIIIDLPDYKDSKRSRNRGQKIVKKE